MLSELKKLIRPNLVELTRETFIYAFTNNINEEEYKLPDLLNQ